MPKKQSPYTSVEKIPPAAIAWRQRDMAAIQDKTNPDKQRAEYRARQDLRKVIDEAGDQP